MTDTLSRKEAEAIGQAINKPVSTIYRWRKDNPPLFAAVREYAGRHAGTPSGDQDSAPQRTE